ncbi:MAG: hypothetical protein Q8M69_04600 [Reyranella sp.]|nr:hypothetical protein [Reyranella sp.]
MDTTKLIAVAAATLLFDGSAMAQSGGSAGGSAGTGGGSVNQGMAPAPLGSGGISGGATGTTR